MVYHIGQKGIYVKRVRRGVETAVASSQNLIKNRRKSCMLCYLPCSWCCPVGCVIVDVHFLSFFSILLWKASLLHLSAQPQKALRFFPSLQMAMLVHIQLVRFNGTWVLFYLFFLSPFLDVLAHFHWWVLVFCGSSVVGSPGNWIYPLSWVCFIDDQGFRGFGKFDGVVEFEFGFRWNRRIWYFIYRLDCEIENWMIMTIWIAK